MANYDISIATNLSKEDIISSIVHANKLKLISIEETIDLDNLKERVKLLEDEIYEVEIFEYITSGTTGRIETPEGSTIRLDQYDDLSDCLLSQTENSQPNESPSYDSDGNIILCSLDADGNYIFDGEPSVYPVAIIYQVAIKGSDIGNIPLDIIINWGELNTADNIIFDNTKSGVDAENVQTAIDKLFYIGDEQLWSKYMQNWLVAPFHIHNTTDGEIYQYTFTDNILYRYIPNDYDSQNDAFYSGFDGENLTNIVAKRAI